MKDKFINQKDKVGSPGVQCIMNVPNCKGEDNL